MSSFHCSTPFLYSPPLTGGGKGEGGSALANRTDKWYISDYSDLYDLAEGAMARKKAAGCCGPVDAKAAGCRVEAVVSVDRGGRGGARKDPPGRAGVEPGGN